MTWLKQLLRYGGQHAAPPAPAHQLAIRNCIASSSIVVAAVSAITFLAVLFAPSLARAESTCPNEALRQELGSGFLPDCRAYEMISPVFKEGYEFYLDALSSDGNRALVDSLGPVAGAKGGIEEDASSTVYLDTRTAAGWQLEPLNAPPTEYDQLFVAGEPTNGMSLWDQHEPAQPVALQDLYTRSPSGVYTMVGPLSTPAHSVGEPGPVFSGFSKAHATWPEAATSDYGHIVLESQEIQALWPFDETKSGTHNSLYEYSGSGNTEPILVAVSGGKGSRTLLGECGAELGTAEQESGSRYNALSSDGETIFFSLFPHQIGACEAPAPPVVEVWARRHGSLTSPAAAESVDVSARAPEPACSGSCRVSSESGKEFEGASEDGERVFFASTQQLTDGASQDPDASDNATNEVPGEGCSETVGAGGCNLYEYDFGAASGQNLRLVAGGGEVLGVARIAESGSRVYFVAKGKLTNAGNEFGATPVPGQPNLYVYDTEEAEQDPGYQPTFIATLGPNDSADWQRLDERPVAATVDGRFLVFASSQPGLTPGDITLKNQLFEYDAQTAELVRITQGENGYNDNGNAASAGVPIGTLASSQVFSVNEFKSAHHNSPISDDGMTVVFIDAGRLSAAASSAEQGCRSLYEYRSSGRIADGSVHLISDGVDVQSKRAHFCGVSFTGMDATGANVFFETDDSLLPEDTDGGQRDTYDARVDGGFPSALSPAGCRGITCEGSVITPPNLPTPATTELTAPGNFPPPGPVTRVASKPMTKAQLLARTLRSCKHRYPHSKSRRTSCERTAHKRYPSRK
jgi:hypothetical protein